MAKYSIGMNFAAEQVIVEAPPGREIPAAALWELGDSIVTQWNIDFPLGGEDEWAIQDLGRVDVYESIPRPS